MFFEINKYNLCMPGDFLPDIVGSSRQSLQALVDSHQILFELRAVHQRRPYTQQREQNSYICIIIQPNLLLQNKNAIRR